MGAEYQDLYVGIDVIFYFIQISIIPAYVSFPLS